MCRIRLLASKFVHYFLKKTLCLICRIPLSRLSMRLPVSIELIAIYFHSFEIFIIQIGEIAFCKPQFIVIKSNYFQNAQKGECFLERRFRALVLQNAMRSRNVILKAMSSKNVFCNLPPF
jgi:hypothetical protein